MFRNLDYYSDAALLSLINSIFLKFSQNIRDQKGHYISYN